MGLSYPEPSDYGRFSQSDAIIKMFRIELSGRDEKITELEKKLSDQELQIKLIQSFIDGLKSIHQVRG